MFRQWNAFSVSTSLLVGNVQCGSIASDIRSGVDIDIYGRMEEIDIQLHAVRKITVKSENAD